MSLNQCFAIKKCAFLLASVILVSGCASTTSKFTTDDVEQDERVIVGRVKILQFGKDITSSCAVVFEGANNLQLEEQGLVFHKVNADGAKIKGFVCNQTSPYHFTLDVPVDLKIAKDPKFVNYFGDVTVEWNFNGGLKLVTLLGGGLLAGLLDSGNDGELTYTVANEYKKTAAVYHKRFGKKAQSKYQVQLIPAENRVPAAAEEVQQ
jgi:hypothetical protein